MLKTTIIFANLLLLSLFLLALATPALAIQYGLTETATKAGYNLQNDKNFEPIINKVISGFLAALAIFFLGLMLYAGIRWMTARGTEELVEKSQHTIQAAIIGLAIVLSAYAIVNFVFGRLGA